MKVMRPVLILINIVLVLFIWGNSAKPAEVSSEQSGGLAVFLENTAQKFNIVLTEGQAQHFIRKSAHFTEYAALGFLLGAAFSVYGKKLKVYGAHVLLLCGIIAVTDEYIQLFFPGRSAEVTDVMLDFTGAVSGFLAVCLLVFFVQCRRKKKAS